MAPLVPVFTPPHRLLMLCPPARVRCTVQPLIAAAPLLCTVTVAWKPLPQLLTNWYVAVQPPGPPVGGADVGGAEVGGADVGGADVGGADVGGAEVGVPPVRVGVCQV